MSETVDDYTARLKRNMSNYTQSDRIEKLPWICVADLFELDSQRTGELPADADDDTED